MFIPQSIQSQGLPFGFATQPSQNTGWPPPTMNVFQSPSESPTIQPPSLYPLLGEMLQRALMMQLLTKLTGNNTTPASTPVMPTTIPASQIQLNHNDLVNYFLAGSPGGTSGTVEVIEGKYAKPDSRFANAGPNEFDAVIAQAYAGQFKAYVLGLDVVVNPGDNVDTLSNNLMQALQTSFTPEAEVLAKVASVYRGTCPEAPVFITTRL